MTVRISPHPQERCGGPSINPAPNVASATPKIIVRVTFCPVIFVVIKAVNTTYNDVKNAEVDGVIESSPII